MLAAVHATEERLIAPGHIIQISVHLAFYYNERELFASKPFCHILDASQSESDLHLFFWPTKKTITARCLLREDFSGNVAVFNVYK